MTTRIALMGRIRAGKDYVADGTGMVKHRMAEPMYQLASKIFGKPQKGDAGFRRLLQQMGQFGRGIVNDDYPLSPERASFVMMVRSVGRNLWDLGKIEWEKYGLDPAFWSKAVLITPPTYNPNPERSMTLNVIVNDLRFQVDRDVFEKAGFQTFLVLCTEETRNERILKHQEKFDGIPRSWESYIPGCGFVPGMLDKIKEEHRICDCSEELATRLSNQILYSKELKVTPEFPISNVVWNDHRDPPEGSILHEDPSYLTTAKFHTKFKCVAAKMLNEE